MSKSSIGLAMLTHNEETHIPASIAQFYLVVDDIVVVDEGSGDKSVEWSERMGARVFHKPFENDFSAQKNYAMEQLKTDWIYVHEAYERLEPALLEILSTLTTQEGQQSLAKAGFFPNSEEPYDCFGFSRKTIVDGIQIPEYPDYQYRLFKNYCRYEGAVDEQLRNFVRRTEIKSPGIEQGSHFNILHYESRTRREQQEALYRKIKDE